MKNIILKSVHFFTSRIKKKTIINSKMILAEGISILENKNLLIKTTFKHSFSHGYIFDNTFTTKNYCFKQIKTLFYHNICTHK